MTLARAKPQIDQPSVIIVAESGDAGGIGRYCVDLAAGLGPGAHVACLCAVPCSAADGCWLVGQCEARDVRLHRIPMAAKAWRRGFRGLVHLWRRTGRPMIHLNGRRGNFVGLVARLSVPGFRYVTTVHGVLHLHDRRNVVYRVVDLAAGRLANATIAVSGHSRALLLRAGSPGSRTITIPNGLGEPDLRRLHEIGAERIRAPRRGSNVRVGFLGRLSPEKGTHELLEVARQLARPGNAATLEIAGDGPEREKLMDESRGLTEAGLIRWRGVVQDAALFLRDVDVLVIPSRNEGMPYVLLEGMAAGCAVVAFAVGGIPEVVSDPSLGVIIEPGDVQGFVAAVDRLVRDPALVTELGVAASAHIERHFGLAGRLPAIRRLYGLDVEPVGDTAGRQGEVPGG